MTDEKSLNDRLHTWLAEEASEVTADFFAERIRHPLRELGYSPTGPCTEEEWKAIRPQLDDLLSALGVTLEALKQAAEETKRAREKGWALREWMSNAFRRHLDEDSTDEAIERAEKMFEVVEGTNNLEEPPQPEDVLAYRRILDAVGGGASLAAMKETIRQQSGGFPTN